MSAMQFGTMLLLFLAALTQTAPASPCKVEAEIVSRVDKAKASLTSLYNERRAILAQLRKLNDQPLSKAKGLFDKNYDEDHLRSKLALNASAIETETASAKMDIEVLKLQC